MSQPHSKPMIWTAPNLITLARMLLIPVIVWFIMSGDPGLRIAAGVLFAFAAGTDWVDGMVARRYDLVSPLGRMLDPIADKLLVGLVLVVLAWDGSLSAADLVAVLAILFREFFISGLREYLGAEKIVVAVTRLAKWKTTLQLVAIVAILFERTFPLLVLPSDLLLWVAAIITVWTGIQYFSGAWPHFSGRAS